jgi:RNA polymerase sigma-70 factor (ECF subfamily)
MVGERELQTSSTLLSRVKQEPRNQAAWAEFVERYSRLIYRWCRSWGLQVADAEDVTQDVLLELARQMREFTYDRTRSFRGWLRVVSYRAWCRLARSRIKENEKRDEMAISRLRTAEAGAQFLQTLELEGDRELLELAIERVRDRVQPNTWDCFRLMAVEGRSGQEVADQLRMNVGTVFVARGKVQRMIRAEFERLDGHAEPTGPNQP